MFVDNKAPSSGSSYDLNFGRIDRKAVEEVLEIKRPSMWDKLLWRKFDPRGIAGEGRKVLFLVCGPDPCVFPLSGWPRTDGGWLRMISVVAGPWGRNYSQGSVGGVLGQLGFGSNQVRKL